MLFVHGIGEQKRGAALEEFGGSLVDWARAWFGADGVRSLGLEAGAGEPVHQAYLVSRPDGAPLRLLLAESHWAADVDAPDWRSLMGWLFSAVPFVVQRAFDAWMRRCSRRIDESLAALAPQAGGDAGARGAQRAAHAGLVLVAGTVRVAVNVLAVAVAALVVILLWLLGLLAGAPRVRDWLFGAAPRELPIGLLLAAGGGLAAIPLVLCLAGAPDGAVLG
ncbi:MAG: hypothetical protein ACRDLN_10015, partial [Solirubrobacteraceae bacterium]